ncbi:MAG: redox-regulated ATPase YchF [Candidatus Aenigmarchaeota archaeon]|nr:redox-regulated ATPase YchF [Candidatus Aenigmarchaeota archaeon]
MLIGLVGAPSKGKSSFFKAATMADVAIASYPFTTISPNHGVGFVRVECVERELKVKCNPRVGVCRGGIRFVPVDLIDVAGLVPGAHEGKGLGNQFLSDLNQADVLIQIIDCSGTTDEKGESATGYDPAKEIKFLEEEIELWFAGILRKGWEKFARVVQGKGEEIEVALAKQLSALKVTENLVAEGIRELKLDRERPEGWTGEQLIELARIFRKATKPIVIACNKIDLPGAADNFKLLKEQFPGRILVACSAQAEIALKEADKKGLIDYRAGDKSFEVKQPEKISRIQMQGLDFIRRNVLEVFGSTGIQECLDKAVFELLKYSAVFPGGISKLADSQGRVLPDCFLFSPGSNALDFANKIHGDLAKHFLYAMNVKIRQRVGKDYILRNRDVIEIVSAAK